jgi:hypothetical protein
MYQHKGHTDVNPEVLDVPVDLTPRHWLAVLLVLILAAAAGVGVPLALRVQAGASLEERLEAARRLLAEVPLIDG